MSFLSILNNYSTFREKILAFAIIELYGLLNLGFFCFAIFFKLPIIYNPKNNDLNNYRDICASGYYQIDIINSSNSIATQYELVCEKSS